MLEYGDAFLEANDRILEDMYAGMSEGEIALAKEIALEMLEEENAEEAVEV